MIATDYDRFCEILGKLANTYENAASLVTTQKLQLSRFYQQLCIADMEVKNQPEIDLFIGTAYEAQWKSAINSGVTAIQALMLTMAQALLVSADFKAALTSVIASPGGVKQVLDAWQTEMSAGVDNKKFSTVAATGLVAFLNLVGPPTNTANWNTAADAGADYKDSVYDVATIV